MRQLGPYQVVRELGRGGAGVVFEGFDPRLQRKVALKLVQGVEPRHLARFALEAQALAKLDHPNIVKVLHAGEHQGQPFVAMELVEGQDLEGRLAREGALPVEEALDLARALAAALEHAHERGIVHRDVKPSNVLIDREGRPRLTDFGLALHLDATRERLSRSGHALGSPGYWPPEQAQGQLAAIGPRSDVYGLGATLHAMLTARPPFEGESLGELIAAMTRPPAPPSASRPEVPAAVDAVVLRCLAARPEERFAGAGAVAAALRPAGRSARARAAPAPAKQQQQRPARPPLLPIAAAVGLGAALAVVGLSRASGADERARAADVARDEAVAAQEQAVAEAKAAGKKAAAAEVVASGATARATTADERAAAAEARAAAAEARLRAAERAKVAAEEELAALALRPAGVVPAGSPWEEPLVAVDRARELAAAAALPVAAAEAAAKASRALERAIATHRTTDYQSAVRQYTEAIELDPRLARAYRNRASARAVYGDHAPAIVDYGLAIGLGERALQAGGPGLAEVRVELAAALHGRGEERNGTIDFTDYAAAIRDYNRALSLAPEYALSIRGRGLAWFKLGEPARAVADLSAYLQRTAGEPPSGPRRHAEEQLAKARAALPAPR